MRSPPSSSKVLSLFLFIGQHNINKPARKFLRSFRNISDVFASFLKFADLLRPVRMCSDAFRCNQMHFVALGCVRIVQEISIVLNDFRTFLVIVGRYLTFWAYIY